MKSSFIAVVLACLAGMAFADPTVSIFVKDASEFQAIQADLQQLKAGIGITPNLIP